jgi:hypothetical protein
MPQAAPLSSTAPPLAFDSLPYRIDHKSSRISAVLLLAMLLAMACMVIVPVALVLTYAAQDVLEAMVRKPLAVGFLAVGVAAWTGALVAAASRVLPGCWSRRSVTITLERVVVCYAGLLGSTLWTRPLAEFRGIAHRVRATLTGVHHELILVHSARDRSVLLLTAQSISQTIIDRAAALFCLPQIPAHELYSLTKAGTTPGVTPSAMAPLPEAARAA